MLGGRLPHTLGPNMASARTRISGSSSRRLAPSLPAANSWFSFASTGGVTVGAALLAAAILIVYLPAIRGGFIWDDNLLISENPLITAPSGFFHLWINPGSMDYTPLTLTTFWLEWRVWGENTIGYHLLNLLLHAGAAFLIWRILVRLEIRGGWLAALLFAIHPVNAASVAWIAERKNTLSLFFYLLSLSWFLDFYRSRKQWPYVLAIMAAACAFLSKGSTVILPGVMLGCIWWRENKLRRADLVAAAPFLGLASIFAIVTIHFQAQIVTKALAHASLPYRIVRAGEAIWFYLWKDLVPVNLCALYPKWPIVPASVFAYLPAVMAVALVVLFWSCRRSLWGRACLFAWGYFLLGLLPVLGFVNMGFMDQVHVADWWQQIAIIGPLALAGAGIALAMQHLGKVGSGILVSAMALAIVMLGSLTLSEAANYDSAQKFWRHVLALNPASWEACDNLGNALSLQGKLDEAIAQYRQALRLTQVYPTVFYNLANGLRRQGNAAEAIPFYQQALRINPYYREAHNNLGVALKMQGRLDEAIDQYRQALKIDPDYAEAHDSLGVALQAQGNLDEAIPEYHEALRINPESSIARRNLDEATKARKSIDQAMAGARQILKAHSDDPEAYQEMASQLEQFHLYAKAAAIYEEALGSHPRDPHLLANFAWLLATCPDAKVRNGAKAVDLASIANQISGAPDPTIVNPLAAAYAEAGRFPDALATGKRALQLAQKNSDTELSTLIEKELSGFATQQAFTYP